MCHVPPAEEKAALKNAGPARDKNCTNPVNGATGNKYQVETDYLPIAGGLLTFERHYNVGHARLRPMGRGWRHTYDRQFSATGTTVGSVAFVMRPTGVAYQFSRTSTGWETDLDTNARLIDTVVAGKTQWQLALGEDDSTEIYDSTGRLVSIVYANARRVNLDYDANLRLQYVSDMLTGHRLSLVYPDADSVLVSKLVDPAGNVIVYQYAGTANDRRLTSVVYPGANSPARQYLYNESAHTGGADLSDALTGIIDENGQRYASYGYDAMGRGIYTEHAGGVDRYELAYNPDGSTTVTDPLGAARKYSYTTVLGVRRQIGQDQPAGSGCLASNSARTYDANGNVASSTDFNGKVTTHSWDLTRNLLTQAVEANGTSEARTSTTEWHAHWRLPTRIAKPKLRIAYVYNGDLYQGNAVTCAPAVASIPEGSSTRLAPLLCREIHEATGDVSGAAGLAATAVGSPRVWSYAYGEAGQMLGTTLPNGQSISHTYHAESDFSVVGDPFIEGVTILMKAEGSNGSSIFVNSAPHNATTQAAGGGAQITTSSAAFGVGSMSFNSSADYVRVDSAKMNTFWASNWTVEAKIQPAVVNGSSGVMTIFGAWGAPMGASIYVVSTDGQLSSLGLVGYEGGSGAFFNIRVDGVASHLIGQWATVAVTKENMTYRFFVDGVLLHQETRTQNIRNFSGQSAWIGAGHDSYYPYPYRGLIDELRVTLGTARYGQSYTVPNVEFADHGPLPGPSDLGHSKGDLASVTNAAGHVTQYTHYDRAGRVRRMVDPKGVVTEVTYTPRGWVSAVVSTPPAGATRTTTYSYDAAGQLTGVVQPDGSTLSYAYDAAQRLVGVSDERGNTISYTLDAMGNRVAEEIKDPGDVLQRSISRSFDALNRLQQVTGAAQ